MGIKFVTSKRVFGFDESKSEKFVATPVSAGEVSFEKLCAQVCQICGAHRGIVQLVTAGLIDALVNNLEDGKSVRLGEFGIFRPAINVKAKDTAEEANASTVYRRRIRFIAGKSFKNMLDNMSVTRFVAPYTDWTRSGNQSGDNTNPGGSGGDGGGGGDDEFIDPSA